MAEIIFKLNNNFFENKLILLYSNKKIIIFIQKGFWGFGEIGRAHV